MVEEVAWDMGLGLDMRASKEFKRFAGLIVEKYFLFCFYYRLFDLCDGVEGITIKNIGIWIRIRIRMILGVSC